MDRCFMASCRKCDCKLSIYARELGTGLCNFCSNQELKRIQEENDLLRDKLFMAIKIAAGEYHAYPSDRLYAIRLLCEEVLKDTRPINDK